MTISRPCYCTRESVKRALDYAETARTDGQVDRAIEAASDSVEGLLHRRFYPQIATRSFDWPNLSYARPWQLWLDSNEVISVTTLTSGGVTIAPSAYFLRRADDLDEPPYNLLEINLNSAAAFGGGTTPQRDISITGLFGYRNDEAPVGTLAGNPNTTAATVDVSDSSRVGVGDIIRIDNERMLVTGKTMLDTAQTLTADVAASNAATTVPVATGSAYSADEVILVDAERMLVIDVAGNNLIVKRAWDGTALAAHTTGTHVYAPRTLAVQRGAVGTTAASHTSTTPVVRHAPPGLVRDLCVALALDQVLQEPSGYARAGAVQDNSHNNISTSNIRSSKNKLGLGIDSLLDRAETRYGRQARTRAV
jgi:hypothetical protein